MESPDPRDQRVAVIGLGAMGIVAVKNLREEGFDVTGFERSGCIGGLWRFTEDEETLSVLESTVVNVSIDRGCYTDFPFQKGTPPFCSAKQVNQYLESYVDHFGLRPRMRLNTAIKHVAREAESNKWRLDFEFAPSEYYEKVVIATGPHHDPMMPTIQGEKVVILGLGNTGNDVAEELVGKASSVAIAHNHGAVVKAKLIMNEAFGKVNPSWNLDPAPSIKVVNPVVSDTLINRLHAGAIQSIPGIKRIVGPKEIELQDGKIIEADTIICCTGYKYSFDLLAPQISPAAERSSAWLDATGSKGRPLPRLYQNVFSLKEPDSLAFLGCAWFVTSAFSLADIASMCIAQVWAGRAKLPTQLEMEQWMDQQEKRISSLAQRGTVIPASVPARDWLIWADKTAGMGVEEHLGWGLKGWLFWLKQGSLWSMLMDGPQTSAAWRLFDGRRKKWDGARAEIEQANASNIDDNKQD
ncbi:hypothetical protein G7Z17_g8245 [Cylindrodendrum hubeiense]|uniref:Flavin-containing monooxygenase n=1 Tax=Cylindrodendrum hubeiense TaxID=595255 RepID=A0A9P5LEW6_9HYPO|nr:hypothetical protein G7Z17_g8245 [Cylindrodendrum hubeiense]